MNAMLVRCGEWKDIRDIIDDVVKQVIVGAGVGAAVGCGWGAISAIELGPAGMAGVCIISGVAGAGIGATAGASEIQRYIGPFPEPIGLP